MSTIKNSPFEERQSKQFGRYLVAKQDLPAGVLIFKEAPLFVYSQFFETFKSKTDFTCRSCYHVQEKKKAVQCKECNWSFCSEDCTMDKDHCQLECPVLKENKVSESQKAIHYLFLLRAMLLKEKSIAKWNEILNLSSSFGKEDGKYDASLHAASKVAQDLLKACKIPVTISDIVTLLKIMEINSFTFAVDRGNPTLKSKFCGLYATTSLISHSCSGNLYWCRYLVDTEERCTVALYSREAIPAGTMVSFSYVEDYNFEGTRQRRDNLLRDLKFACECRRCTDPTELGTLFSAVKCPGCEDGWLLPNAVVTPVEGIFYKCEKCSQSLEVDKVIKMENSFKKKLANIGSSQGIQRSNNLDLLILNATVKFGLHPNHFLVFEAKEQWFASQQFDDVLLEASSEDIQLYQKVVKRSEDNLAAVKLFGNIDQRVFSESMIGMAAARFYFRSSDYLTICEDIPNLDEKIEIIKKIVDHFQGSISVADPHVYGPTTKNIVPSIRKWYEMWNFHLSECLSQSLRDKVSI